MDLFTGLAQALVIPADGKKGKTKGMVKVKGRGTKGVKGPGPKGPLSGPGEPDPRSVRVFFATNRGVRFNSERKVERVSSERAPNLTYGKAAVRVPEIHEAGSLERPKPRRVLGLTIWTEKEKDTEHFTLSGLKVLTQEQFATAIRAYQSSTALLFVHGFNTDFYEAIYRLAQIVWDTQFRGVPVAFSWPSNGKITDYDYDRESASSSAIPLSRLLHFLHNGAGVSKIYVVAHSMGNQIVMEAIARAPSEGLKIALTELVLAAPDVDRDVFLSLSDQLKKVAKDITLYASSADKALKFSQAKAGGVPSPNKSQNNIITHTYNVIHLRSLLSILYLARFLGFEGFFPNYCDSSATEPISSLFRDKALAL